MKRIIVLLLLFTMVNLSTGCSNSKKNHEEANKENNPIEVVKEEEVPIITSFQALGKTYNENKDISVFKDGDEIYNADVPYAVGEYKEVDFANDLITSYFSNDESIYNYLISETNIQGGELIFITEDEKNRLMDSLNSLKEQMSLVKEDVIYFKLSSVTCKTSKEDNAITIEVKGHISPYDGYYASLMSFMVTVYQKDDKLYANML